MFIKFWEYLHAVASIMVSHFEGGLVGLNILYFMAWRVYNVSSIPNGEAVALHHITILTSVFYGAKGSGAISAATCDKITVVC